MAKLRGNRKMRYKQRKIGGTILALGVSMGMGLSVYAAPAKPGAIKIEQPNGKVITTYLNGDEKFNYTTDEQGYVIAQDTDSYWKYVTVDDGLQVSYNNGGASNDAIVGEGAVPRNAIKASAWVAKEESKQKAALSYSMEKEGITYDPSTGVRKGARLNPESTMGDQKTLVFLIEYEDSKLSTSESDWEKLFFGNGKSVKDYFTTVSGNKTFFMPGQGSGIVRVTLPGNRPTEVNQGRNSSFTAIMQETVKALNNTNIDFKSFDTNDDSLISTNELQVVVVFAGWEASSGKSNEGVWGCSISSTGGIIESTKVTAGGEPVYLLGSKNGLSGKFTVQGEKHYNGPNDYNMATMGIFAHELGHNLGLWDLYNTTNTAFLPSVTGGSLMASGNWGALPNEPAGTTPSLIDAWSRVQLGWVEPTVVEEGMTAAVNTIQDGSQAGEGNVLLVPTDNDKEYFLVENRQLQGYDAGMMLENQKNKFRYRPNSQGGAMIWHINDVIIDSTIQRNQINATAKGNGVMYEYSMEDSGKIDPFFYADSTKNPTVFNSTSTPNSKLADGKDSGVSIKIESNNGNTISISNGEATTQAKEITAVEAVKGITAPVGTAFADLKLPQQVSVTLSDETTAQVDVTWGEGSYDGSVAGKYILEGTFENLPANLTNTTNQKATIEVTVADEVVAPTAKEIKEIAKVEGIKVVTGTEFAALNLPEKVTVVLSDETTQEVNVAWEQGTYDKETAGKYTLEGSLVDLPEDITNPADQKATIEVTVTDEVVAPTAKEIKEIAKVEGIKVVTGTEFAALNLPEKVTVVLSDETTQEVNVAWEQGTYDKETAGKYTLEGSLVSLPEGVTNPTNQKAAIEVTVEAEGTEKPEQVKKSFILAVNKVEDITVAYGTAFETVELPKTVDVRLSNFKTVPVEVTWEKGEYSETTPGTYTIKGELTNLPDHMSNIMRLKAKVKLTVTEGEAEKPEAKDIVAVVNPADMTAKVGTAFDALALPGQVEVTLSDDTTVLTDVKWSEEGYQADQVGEYTLEGELINLPEGITNETAQKAQIKVSLTEEDMEKPEKPEVKDIVAVVNPADMTAKVGTAFDALALPGQVEVTLSDDTTVLTDVKWSEEGYQADQVGEYTLEGELINLPEGITNETAQKAQIKVSLTEEEMEKPEKPEAKEITGIQEVTGIKVAPGVEFSALNLPKQVTVTLSDNTTENVNVTWEQGKYDKDTVGSYILEGTLVDLPEGITNAANQKAMIEVIVEDKQPEEEQKEFIMEVSKIKPMTVAYDTAFEALGLPKTVEVSLSNFETVAVEVEWKQGKYNEKAAGIYTITGQLVNLPADIENVMDLKARVKVTVEPSETEVPDTRDIIAVAGPKDFAVKVGTTFGDLQLPSQVEATLSDNTTRMVDVEWKEDGYQAEQVGEYTVQGELVNLPYGITNETSKTASVKVTVTEEEPQKPQAGSILKVADLNNVKVAQGTEFSNISLPAQVDVILDNLSTVAVDVTWEAGEYDSSKPNMYILQGTLTNVPSAISNTNGYTASIGVIVMDPEEVIDENGLTKTASQTTEANEVDGVTIIHNKATMAVSQSYLAREAKKGKTTTKMNSTLAKVMIPTEGLEVATNQKLSAIFSIVEPVGLMHFELATETAQENPQTMVTFAVPVALNIQYDVKAGQNTDNLTMYKVLRDGTLREIGGAYQEGEFIVSLQESGDFIIKAK